jgi:uncharacterized protein YegL
VRIAFWLAALALVCTPASAAEKIWLDLETPLQGARVRSPVGLVDVRGWAGTRVRGGHDVLIVIDRSLSVWEPSGADIDRDGRVGELRGSNTPARAHAFWTTDAGDTIFQAEIAAARKLIERLDRETTRMGIILFGGRARVLAPLGSSDEELLHALDRMPSHADPGGTHFYQALKRALESFEAVPPPQDDQDEVRHRAIILLSDGLPTAPPPVKNAEAFTLVGARRAADAGVRVYAFAVGPRAAENPRVFEQITSMTGGDLVMVDQPVDVIDFVPHVSLTSLTQVTIDNLSMSQKARAVRLFPDGTFDGYAPLRPGENLLRITLHAEGGAFRHLDRVVHFEKVPATTRAQKAAARQLLKELRIRTLETELATRVRRKKAAERARRLEIEVE